MAYLGGICWGFCQDHRAHAHHPQLIPTFTHQNTVATQPALLNIVDEGQRAILGRLRLLMSDHGRQLQIAL